MTAQLLQPEKDIYLAIPRSPGKVVLVIHSWWGFTSPFRELCNSLSNKGYLTAAVDLFSGETAQTEGQARKLRAHHRPQPVYKTLLRALQLAREHSFSSVQEAAVIGFSMGGHWAFWLSRNPDYRIDRVISFYAVRNSDFKHSIAEYQIHLAADDPWVSKSALKQVEKSLSCAKKGYAIFKYPGTKHWFFESDRKEYDRKSARLALKRTVEFLDNQVRI